MARCKVKATDRKQSPKSHLARGSGHPRVGERGIAMSSLGKVLLSVLAGVVALLGLLMLAIGTLARLCGDEASSVCAQLGTALLLGAALFGAAAYMVA
jgi:hypothetical protein